MQKKVCSNHISSFFFFTKPAFLKVSSSYDRESGKQSTSKACHFFQEDISMFQVEKLTF